MPDACSSPKAISRGFTSPTCCGCRRAGRFLAQAAPDALAELQRRHDAFRALLQINLTVLATAHAVSEGIIRGVSGELQRKSTPQTYGASGRANVPARNAVEPLAVSRSL